jgi:methylphosphotriester-DNA--protein-cysteine methyltransferase
MAELGVLYTEYSSLKAMTRLASLWSYESRVRERDRRTITLKRDGSHEYWLDRSDPLLNTILPSTHVSLIINLGDKWAASRSLTTSEYLPNVCVVGPVTRARVLRVGRCVHALGAVLPPTLTHVAFGLPASDLVDRIVPLHDLWARDDVERLLPTFYETRRCLSVLKDELGTRLDGATERQTLGESAARFIKRHDGRVSIDDIAKSNGLSRQQFALQFCAAAGLRPKLFARITRFQALVHLLLSTDMSLWASVSLNIGFYDQAHMINEFGAFAGSPPTTFFRPHGGNVDPASVQPRGRPSEWLSRPEATAVDAFQ